MLKGNKGEWSELYTFLKLLGEGELYAADEKMEKLHNIYYPIIKVLRIEKGKELEYVCEDEFIIIDDERNNHTTKIPIIEFQKYALLLLDKIKSASGSSFTIQEIDQFLEIIKFDTLKSKSSRKSDIRIVVHDSNTGMKPMLGFSIKSKLGRPSTLFNAGKSTNFVYKINGDINDTDLRQINTINTRTYKIRNRLALMEQKDLTLDFVKVSNEMFDLNLKVIDSEMPKILSELVLYYFSGRGSHLNELSKLIEKENPLNYNNLLGHSFYEYKLKAFLRDVALGLTPRKRWDGEFDATGGYIIVKEDGELVCYHIYNQNEFQGYLLNNTKLDTPSSSKHGFGEVYKVGNEYFFNLNFQIRFN